MQERDAYPVAEAAHRLGIGRTKCFELIADGQLRAIRVGGRRLVTRTAIADFLAAAESDAGGATGTRSH